MQISTVIPVYNTDPRFLERSINSVLNQTLKPLEILVVNDGSTRQETLDFINTIRDTELISVFDQENKKVSGALNTGIRNMKGEWWAGLSSDDMWVPHKLEKQVEFVKQHPEAKVVYADYAIIGVNDEIIAAFYTEPSFSSLRDQQRFLIGSYFGMWSNMLVHKSVFDKVGMFNEEFIACEDYEMVIRISKYFRYYKVPEVLTSYRHHPEQNTHTKYGFNKEIGRVYDQMCHQLAKELFS